MGDNERAKKALQRAIDLVPEDSLLDAGSKAPLLSDETRNFSITCHSPVIGAEHQMRFQSYKRTSGASGQLFLISVIPKRLGIAMIGNKTSILRGVERSQADR